MQSFGDDGLFQFVNQSHMRQMTIQNGTKQAQWESTELQSDNLKKTIFFFFIYLLKRTR